MNRFFIVLFALSAGSVLPLKTDKKKSEKALITVMFNGDNPVNSFIPDQSIGGAIDGHEKGDIGVMMSPRNIKSMLSSGIQMLSYRLRTELGIEAWHWNPSGHWSDSKNQRGYWISDTVSKKPIELSYGHALPRRGSTFDQANNKGYSRIDDGDMNSFWKSNPYLDSLFTGQPNSSHEQWIAIDLGKKEMVNQLEIYWADPYADDIRLEFASDESVSLFNRVDILNPYQDGMWKPLPVSKIHLTHGGKTVIQFSDRPVKMRVLRVVFLKSSHTALPGHMDKRDSCGYAIREIKLGLSDKGVFRNLVRYGKTNKTQSVIFPSTTDPWHRAKDKDYNTEQPGVDFIFKSGLAGTQPSLFATGIVYDVPENALSLLSYLGAKKYAIFGMELGEEPDGQYISPTDFTELYAQFAKRIKESDPNLPLGGPSFEGLLEEGNIVKKWPAQFLGCLKERDEMNLINFFSFEWYPLDDVCLPASPQLLQEPRQLSLAIRSLHDGGLAENFPIYITESGYSVLAAEPEVRIEGALLNADVIGQFFELKGGKIFIYGWEPSWLINESNGCGGYGNLEFFGLDDNGEIKFLTGLYYSTWLCLKKWAQPGDQSLKIYNATCSVNDEEGNRVITAYPLCRPDGKWSILLINKSDKKGFNVNINVVDATGRSVPLDMNADLYQFSEREFKWQANEEKGHPIRSKTPEAVHLQDDNLNGVEIPAYSVSVICQR